MTLQVFLVLLAICAVVTSLITEAIKKIHNKFEHPYAANIIALVDAIFVGAIVMILYYVFNAIDFSAVNIVYIFLMALANWIGSMIGYDKVKQALIQIRALKEEDKKE